MFLEIPTVPLNPPKAISFWKRWRFLIDECLHTSLVEVANDAGYEAHHVVYRGWAGFEDHQLRPIILREEFVFVTNNGRHFLELLAETELHPGLVIIIPNEKPALQRELFHAALAKLKSMPSVLNKVVEVQSRQEVRVCDLPKLIRRGLKSNELRGDRGGLGLLLRDHAVSASFKPIPDEVGAPRTHFSFAHQIPVS